MLSKLLFNVQVTPIYIDTLGSYAKLCMHHMIEYLFHQVAILLAQKKLLPCCARGRDHICFQTLSLLRSWRVPPRCVHVWHCYHLSPLLCLHALIGLCLIQQVFDLLMNGSELVEKLQYNTDHFRKRMQEAGFTLKVYIHAHAVVTRGMLCLDLVLWYLLRERAYSCWEPFKQRILNRGY